MAAFYENKCLSLSLDPRSPARRTDVTNGVRYSACVANVKYRELPAQADKYRSYGHTSLANVEGLTA